MKIRDNLESGHFRIDSVFIRERWGSVLGSYGVAAYTVLACLADNETQECWPSYRYIADAGGMSRSEAYRQTEKLVKLRLIHKKPRYKTGTNHRNSNLYTLLHHSVWQPPGGSVPEQLRSVSQTQHSVREGQGSVRESKKLTSRTKPQRTKPKGTNKKTSKYKWVTDEEFEKGWYLGDEIES